METTAFSSKSTPKRLFIVAFIMLLLATGLLVFNRAPRRTSPEGNTIVSPANGLVIAIEEEKSNEVSFFKKDILNSLEVEEMTPPFNIVVIEMDLKNVHVQRAPISGTMTAHQYFPGKFKNALYSDNKEELVNENEKMLSLFKNDDIQVGVIQVAGILARRIKITKRDGDVVEKGEIFGRITLGSQVVVILPKDISLDVKVGDVLVDGESVIATY